MSSSGNIDAPVSVANSLIKGGNYNLLYPSRYLSEVVLLAKLNHTNPSNSARWGSRSKSLPKAIRDGMSYVLCIWPEVVVEYVWVGLPLSLTVWYLDVASRQLADPGDPGGISGYGGWAAERWTISKIVWMLWFVGSTYVRVL